MANGNGVHPSEYSGTASMYRDEFERMGHPGKYHRCITVVSGQTVDFTGSNYGAAAIIIGNTASGSIQLSGTGSLNIAQLSHASPLMFDLSIRQVTVTGTDKYVHVLIRNSAVR